jgi:hypothetical protein
MQPYVADTFPSPSASSNQSFSGPCSALLTVPELQIIEGGSNRPV